MHDDDNNNEECYKYLYEILDTSLVTITNSRREGVVSDQSDPTMGVGTQVLPTPTDEYDSESGESGGLLKGTRREENT